LDIEGGESEALTGATKILKFHPKMIIETHSAYEEDRCIEILKGSGYAPVVVKQRRYFRELRPIPHNRWLICA
jgi:hypothetical protein